MPGYTGDRSRGPKRNIAEQSIAKLKTPKRNIAKRGTTIGPLPPVVSLFFVTLNHNVCACGGFRWGSKIFWALWRIVLPLKFFEGVGSPLLFTALFLVSEWMTGYYLAFNFQVWKATLISRGVRR